MKPTKITYETRDISTPQKVEVFKDSAGREFENMFHAIKSELGLDPTTRPIYVLPPQKMEEYRKQVEWYDFTYDNCGGALFLPRTEEDTLKIILLLASKFNCFGSWGRYESESDYGCKFWYKYFCTNLGRAIYVIFHDGVYGWWDKGYAKDFADTINKRISDLSTLRGAANKVVVKAAQESYSRIAKESDYDYSWWWDPDYDNIEVQSSIAKFMYDVSYRTDLDEWVITHGSGGDSLCKVAILSAGQLIFEVLPGDTLKRNDQARRFEVWRNGLCSEVYVPSGNVVI